MWDVRSTWGREATSLLCGKDLNRRQICSELSQTENIKDFWKKGRTGEAGREEEEEGHVGEKGLKSVWQDVCRSKTCYW